MRKTLLVLGTVAILFAVMFCVASVAQATVNEPGTEQSAVPGLLRGIVVDDDGNPIAGADVFIRPTRDDQEKVVTDENGRFQMEIPQRLFHPMFFCAVLPNTDLMGHQLLRQITDEVEITLQKGRRFFGKVVDENGNPVADAYVGASAQALTIDPVLTNEQGEFEFLFFQMSTNNVFAIKPGVGYDFLGLETRNSVSIASTPLQQEHGPLLLTLTKVAPIAFRVTNEEGQPLAGMKILPGSLRKADGSTSFPSINATSHLARKLQLFSVTTDKDGNATIDWIPRGTSPEFVAHDPQECYGFETMTRRWWTRTYSAQLPRRVRIEGSVRLADGTPVPWARLAFVSHGRGNGETRADAMGNFSFSRNPHEIISVAVESNLGAAPAAVHVNAGDGSNPPRIDFVLEKGTRFFGTVLAGSDRKSYPANVHITEMVSDDSSLPVTIDRYERRRAPTRTIRVDENGNFETRLPSGKFEVRTSLPRAPDGRHGGDFPIEFEIADEAEKRLDFYFPDNQKENAIVNLAATSP